MHFESDLVYNLPHPQAHFHVANPGMRYDSSHPSYHFSTPTTTTTRQHTPSPVDSQLFHSRSCSSPGASVGPTRTTRTRRTGSFGSTSSPPPPPSAHFTNRPQAIVIPRSSNSYSHASGGGSVGLSMSPLSPMSPTSPISSTSASSTNHGHGGWYNMPTTNPDFSLPESLHSGGGYNAELYLPPVSALQHHHSHSSSKSDHFVSYANGNNNGINNGTGLMNGVNGMNGLSSFNGSPVPLSLTTPSLGFSCGFGLNGVKTKKNGLTTSTRTRTMAGSATTTGRLFTAQENQALLANEKRRRRRESHNAVERRRRDNINERITELATLIPECMLEVSGTNPIHGTPEEGGDGSLPSPLEASENASTGSPQDTSSAKKEDSDAGCGGAMKANKGMILRKSVDYIRYLQQLASVQGTRNSQLEAELKAYKAATGVEGQSNSCSSSCSSSSSPLRSSARSTSTSTSSPATDAEEKSKEWTDSISMQQNQRSRQSPPCNTTANSHNGLDSSSSNGFGSFGNLFSGLPSMPEEEDSSAEDYDVDMCVVDGESNEKSERGRTRVQCHGPAKIKEELDLILMEA